MGVEIPEKLYFRIGEVSKLTRTPHYVLRFWETQFPMLKPRKSSSGQRMFRRKEVELVLEIRKLLYQQGFTIEGAKKKLGREGRQQALPFQDPSREVLRTISRELRELLVMLDRSK
jgi:DNA-binding transcriptional MerR regulator